MLLMRYGADLNAKNNDGDLPIEIARTEEIKQVISDEPRRRMDEAPGKRATEPDRHPNTVFTSSFTQQEEEEEEIEDGQNNKRACLDEGVVVQASFVVDEETKVLASEDEDSEPSSDEGEDDD